MILLTTEHKVSESKNVVPPTESAASAKKRQINWIVLEQGVKKLCDDLNEIDSVKRLLDIVASLDNYEVVPYSDVLIGTLKPARWDMRHDLQNILPCFELRGEIEFNGPPRSWRAMHRSGWYGIQQTNKMPPKKHINVVNLGRIWYDRPANTWKFYLYDHKKRASKEAVGQSPEGR